VRNVGAGIAVLQAWHAVEGRQGRTTGMPDLDAFRPANPPGRWWRGLFSRFWDIHLNECAEIA
jgi:hypothetical protein